MNVYDLLWHLLAQALRGHGRRPVIVALTRVSVEVERDVTSYDWHPSAVCGPVRRFSGVLVEVKPTRSPPYGYDEAPWPGADTDSARLGEGCARAPQGDGLRPVPDIPTTGRMEHVPEYLHRELDGAEANAAQQAAAEAEAKKRNQASDSSKGQQGGKGKSK